MVDDQVPDILERSGFVLLGLVLWQRVDHVLDGWFADPDLIRLDLTVSHWVRPRPGLAGALVPLRPVKGPICPCSDAMRAVRSAPLTLRAVRTCLQEDILPSLATEPLRARRLGIRKLAHAHDGRRG